MLNVDSKVQHLSNCTRNKDLEPKECSTRIQMEIGKSGEADLIHVRTKIQHPRVVNYSLGILN